MNNLLNNFKKGWTVFHFGITLKIFRCKNLFAFFNIKYIVLFFILSGLKNEITKINKFKQYDCYRKYSNDNLVYSNCEQMMYWVIIHEKHDAHI